MSSTTKVGRILAITATSVLIALTTGQAASAGTSSLLGNIASSCTLTLGSNGILAASTDATSLSSKNAGGAPAGLLLLSTGAFKLEVDTLSSFALAPTNGQPDTLDVTFNATGVSVSTGRLAGSALNLGIGLTNVTIDTVATKTSGIFPAGAYRADVVTRCVTQ